MCLFAYLRTHLTDDFPSNSCFINRKGNISNYIIVRDIMALFFLSKKLAYHTLGSFDITVDISF